MKAFTWGSDPSVRSPIELGGFYKNQNCLYKVNNGATGQYVQCFWGLSNGLKWAQIH